MGVFEFDYGFVCFVWLYDFVWGEVVLDEVEVCIVWCVVIC